MQITEKYQEMTSKLMAFLKNCSVQKENVEHQLADIAANKFNIETLTQMAIEEMRQQRLFVNQDISESFEEQINRIKRTKEKELKDFDAQAIRLQQHYCHRKVIEDCASDLVVRSRTPDFITEASDFLNQNRLKKLPAKKEKPGEVLLYRYPTFKGMQDPGERRRYVENEILGYFATEDEYQHRFKESDITAEAEIGDLKRFGSTRSVGGDSAATAISATSRLSVLSHSISQWYLPSIVTGDPGSVEFISSTHIRIFKGSALKAFSNVFFSDNTLWITGWNRNLIGAKTLFLLNVDLPEY